MRTTLACFALLFSVTAVHPEPAFAQAKKRRRAPAAETKAEPAPEPAAPAAAEPEPVPEPEPVKPESESAKPEPRHESASVSAAPAAAAAGKKKGAQRGILVELEAPYYDSGTIISSEKLFGLEQLDEDEQEVGVSRWPAVSVSATFMAPITRLIRLGGGFRYMSTYRYEVDPPEDDPDAEPVEGSLGRMVEFYGRAEVLIPLIKKLDLVPVLEVGVPLLIPGGDLRQTINEYDVAGFNVSTGPRLGILVGGDLAARYSFATWFAVRGGFGMRYERLFLYNASTSDDGGEVKAHMNILRFKPFVGVEFGF